MDGSKITDSLKGAFSGVVVGMIADLARQLIERKIAEAKTPQAIKQYFPVIKSACTKYNIPFNFALALIQTESSFNPAAKQTELGYYDRYIKDRSPWTASPFYSDPSTIAASYGLTQIMYPTAIQYGFPPSAHPSTLLDPANSLEYGFRYLAQVFFPADPALSYLRYNAGPGTTMENASELARANLTRFLNNLALVNQTYRYT